MANTSVTFYTSVIKKTSLDRHATYSVVEIPERETIMLQMLPAGLGIRQAGIKMVSLTELLC